MANNEVRVLNPGEEGELRERWKVNKGERRGKEGGKRKEGREGGSKGMDDSFCHPYI